MASSSGELPAIPTNGTQARMSRTPGPLRRFFSGLDPEATVLEAVGPSPHPTPDCWIGRSFENEKGTLRVPSIKEDSDSPVVHR